MSKKKLSLPDPAQLLDVLAKASDILAKVQYIVTFAQSFLSGKKSRALPAWFGEVAKILVPILIQILGNKGA